MREIAIANASMAPESSFNAMFQSFLAYLDARETSARTYSLGVKSLLSFMRRTGSPPTRETILAWREALKASRRPSTVKTYLAGVRRFFAWLVQQGIFAVNPALGVKGARIEKGFKRDCLTASQARELLESVDTSGACGLRDYAMLALMLTTGLRDCEVARAKVGDLGTLAGESVLFVHGKGHDAADAPVKLAPKVERALRLWLKERGQPGPKEPLFVSLSSRPSAGGMTTRSVSRIVKARLKGIGLNSSRLTAHSLRHTAATLNLLAGGSLEETQSLLRHASVTTTMIYAHHLDFAKRQAEARIEAAIM